MTPFQDTVQQIFHSRTKQLRKQNLILMKLKAKRTECLIRCLAMYSLYCFLSKFVQFPKALDEIKRNHLLCACVFDKQTQIQTLTIARSMFKQL
jgi:hypothetical protein